MSPYSAVHPTGCAALYPFDRDMPSAAQAAAALHVSTPVAEGSSITAGQASAMLDQPEIR
ncbi:hypothetical protein PZ897_01540 [Hoeflea sp. YIM 152468]|uniref:hypothetical protein n=1 Tax=Hoeflea sp. YIM 152468 TaxID=3031759 RepID=UPI0023DB8A28|nr:hypothetical protein [Hoeflea sp. YIM 152468]MDF1606851.1 hypothetical protein [Hoeflea sp. YIM 152468]